VFEIATRHALTKGTKSATPPPPSRSPRRLSPEQQKAKDEIAARAANDSTEYEGPSLAEQADFIKTFLEGVDEGRVGDFFRKHKKKLATVAATGVLATSMLGGGTGDKTKVGGKNGTGHSPHSQEIGNENPARRLRKAQHSSTEYEGPSLAEQADFIKTFLEGHQFSDRPSRQTMTRTDKTYPSLKQSKKGRGLGKNGTSGPEHQSVKAAQRYGQTHI
jgi:hypothetical protein